MAIHIYASCDHDQCNVEEIVDTVAGWFLPDEHRVLTGREAIHEVEGRVAFCPSCASKARQERGDDEHN